MKQRLSCLSVILSLVFFSCQKEASVENGGGNPNSGTGDLLTKIESNEGGEAYTIIYEYNASKLLIREKITGISQGVDIGNDLTIQRNSSGTITGTVQKNAMASQQGIGDVVSRIHYDAATGRYTSRVKDLTVQGISVTDSTVFYYNSANQVIGEETYLYSASLGIPPELSIRNEYTLGADGSITDTELYIIDAVAGTEELAVAIRYTYDGKVSPLILPPGEAAAIGKTDFVAKQNVSKLEYNDVSNGGTGSFNIESTYTYRSDNKPSTATTLQSPGNISGTKTFFYN